MRASAGWRSPRPAALAGAAVRSALIRCARGSPVYVRPRAGPPPALPNPKGLVVKTYPSYGTRLAADLLRERIELGVYPKVVVSGAATLTAANAATLRAAFRCPVVNQYSSWEVPHMARICPNNPGLLHVNSERVILRVVREDGSPAARGERGRVVLIRTPAGKTIAPGALEDFLTFTRDALPYIWVYQAVQTSPDAVVLRVAPRHTSRRSLQKGSGALSRTSSAPTSRCRSRPSTGFPPSPPASARSSSRICR